MITGFDEMLKATAQEIGGSVEVFIQSVEYKPHAAAVEFLITNVKQQ